MLAIEWWHEEWHLYAQRGVHRAKTRTLFVADPHFGKDASFRAAGVPVPGGLAEANLALLDEMIHASGAERLCFLGDFLHARNGRCAVMFDVLQAWRERHASLEVMLVRGNHDDRAGDPPSGLRMECVDEPYEDAGVVLWHDPARVRSRARRPALAGHVHPAVRLVDRDGSTMHCPCFCFGARTAVLPAFGRFTGSAMITPCDEDRVFVIGDGRVVEAQRTLVVQG